MTCVNVKLLIGDIAGVGRSFDTGTRLSVTVEVDVRHAAHNLAAMLLPLDAAARRAALDGLFTENHEVRLVAEASLRDLQADEDARAEREHDEWMRQQAIRAGPHADCGDVCCTADAAGVPTLNRGP